MVCVLSRAGRGDANRGSETSAPVKDGFGEMGVYVPSFRARYSARHSQQRKCVALERGNIRFRLRVNKAKCVSGRRYVFCEIEKLCSGVFTPNFILFLKFLKPKL